jgi:hypothetical protein
MSYKTVVVFVDTGGAVVVDGINVPVVTIK